MAAGRGGGARGRVTGRARRRRGRGALRAADRRRRAPPASRSSRSSPASSASAPHGWRALQLVVEQAHAQRAARPRRRQARRHRRLRRRLRARRCAGATPTPFGAVAGLGADAFTASPYMGVDSLRVACSVARGRASSSSCGRRTRARPTSRTCAPRAASACGSASRGSSTALGAPWAPPAALHDVGAVVGATAPEHLARARELMPRTPFLLPGIGAQGGRVEDLAPAFAAGPRRRAGHRVALDRRAPTSTTAASRPSARPPRGRAAAGAGLVAWVIGPPRRALCSAQPMVNRRRRSIGRWLAPVALITCAVARVRRRGQHAAQGRTARRRAAPARSSTTTKTTSGKAAKKSKRRRAYVVKSGDTLSAISIKTGVTLAHDQAPEPQARRGHAPRRPAGQALAVTARDRRAAAALLAVALGLVLAVALARPASAPAAPPAIRAPAAILVEPATGDVVYQRQARRSRPVASTTKLMTALVTLEHAKLGQVVTTVPYHASPAESIIGLRAGERMTVADLLRGRAAGQRQRRGGDARRARRRLAERLRRAHEPPRPPAGADPHPLRQRDRARRPQQLLERRGPGQAHAHPAAQRVLPRRRPTSRARPCARAPTRG